jgi:hypothetical protein
MGEYATDEQVDKEIYTLYSKCTNPENRKLSDEAKIEMLTTAMKFFFKFCREEKREGVEKEREELSRILEWFTLEMTENLEMFEMLNFYYGLIKDWDKLEADSVIKLVNSGFTEELLPVHTQVHLKFTP